ncbi:MAG TPA: hypothetical protein VJ583_03550 [Nitrososphaeraceae archaeon]|nr:hypothetical protein [Nitrososphaeraceae archaeon]
MQFGNKVLFESNNIVYSTEDIQESLQHVAKKGGHKNRALSHL